jgi:hypothetical protein
MKTQWTALMISLIVAPLGATAVLAATVSDKAGVVAENEVAKPEFKSHATKSFGQPDVVTIDGVPFARKLKVSDSLKGQLEQATTQVHGTENCNYIVPGHAVTGI